VSVVVWGREASSFRHVLGLHASGAELPLFYGLPVLHGNVPLVFHSMLRLSGHSAQWLSQRGRWEVLGLGLVHLHCRGGPSNRNLSPSRTEGDLGLLRILLCQVFNYATILLGFLGWGKSVRVKYSRGTRASANSILMIAYQYRVVINRSPTVVEALHDEGVGWVDGRLMGLCGLGTLDVLR
jgi:hypothetical protein